MGQAAGSRFDFDAVAGSYDGWYESAEGVFYDRLEKDAVQQVLPSAKAGRRLLEVGCGTGHWSRFFVERGFHVVGLDPSPGMVRVAVEKRIGDAQFLVADGDDLPFERGRFDVAAAVTVLEFARDPVSVLAEMARCTRPGGVLVVGVLNRRSPLGLRRSLRPSAIFAEARMPTVGTLRRWLAGYGTAEVRSAAFAWPRFASPVLERIGRHARLPWGDFIVGCCRLD